MFESILVIIIITLVGLITGSVIKVLTTGDNKDDKYA